MKNLSKIKKDEKGYYIEYIQKTGQRKGRIRKVYGQILICSECEEKHFAHNSAIKRGLGKFCSIYCRSRNKNHPLGMLGKHHSEEWKSKMSKIMKGRQVPWLKGKPLTDEHKAKLKGKKLSEEHKKKLFQINKGNKYFAGHKHSEETKRKMSSARKGKHHSEETKEKLKKANLGKKLSEETRKKISKNHKGIKHSEEAKRKMSKSRRGMPRTISQKGINNPFYGKHHSEEARNKIRESHIKYMISGKTKRRNTKIEQKIEEELKKRNIYYQSQIPLCNITIADFYLPRNRTVIYCDGDYWHSRPEVKKRDINQDLILMFHGFNVYRFTEAEINKSAKRCINKILRR